MSDTTNTPAAAEFETIGLPIIKAPVDYSRYLIGALLATGLAMMVGVVPTPSFLGRSSDVELRTEIAGISASLDGLKADIKVVADLVAALPKPSDAGSVGDNSDLRASISALKKSVDDLSARSRVTSSPPKRK